MSEPAKTSVRPARVEDAAFIAALQAEAVADQVAAALGAHQRETVLAQLPLETMVSHWEGAITQGRPTTRGVLTAVEGEENIGFAAYAAPDSPQDPPAGLPFEVPPTSAQILALEVDPQRRGRGHASRLLAAIADLAGAEGVPGLVVWLLGEDQARLRFFQEAGFAPVGLRRQVETGAGPVTEHLWFAALD